MASGLNGTRGLSAALFVAEEYNKEQGTAVILPHNMADRCVAETRQKHESALTGFVQVRIAHRLVGILIFYLTFSINP